MSNPSKAATPSGGDYLSKTLDDRYRIDEIIGAGAIGEVYAGTQLTVDRKVAIKLLHPSVSGRKLGKERFTREAKAVARMSHGNCLTLFDFGSDDRLNCFYMVTEFVEGMTLAEYMADDILPVGQVFQILYQVATALQHAHDRGILHRDLKPENIMLVDPDRASGADTGVGQVKVLDFGLARIRQEAAQPDSAPDDIVETPPSGEFIGSRLTNYGELNGTPAYMSPEQCRGDISLTAACDYYALGVLGFELFEGRLPYRADAVQRLLAKHLNDPIPKMTTGRAPESVETMIYDLLAKPAAHRLRSADEVLETLRAFVRFEPSHELSMSTLDRVKRPGNSVGPPDSPARTPTAGDATLDPDAAGETFDGQSPTLLAAPGASVEPAPTHALGDGHDDAPTIAAGAPNAATAGSTDAPAADESKPGMSTTNAGQSSGMRRRLAARMAVAVVAAAVVGTALWWGLTPLNGPNEPASSMSEPAAGSPADPSPSASDGRNDSRDPSDDGHQTTAPSDTTNPRGSSPDATLADGGAAEQIEPEPADERGRPASGGRPVESAKKPAPTDERQRPRKLDLTY